MNLEHIRTFLWLRWRLFVNQWSRGSKANAVILLILAIAMVPAVLILLAGSFCAGLFLPEEVTPAMLMYIWDGVLVYFLMFWFAGVMVELRRSESLALEKFLHLPVSLSSVFVLNYLSSWFCLSMAVFLPIMVGFSFGLVFSRGPMMLVGVLVLAAFLLMVTALTYQFQGWLASLMVNKRRRRTILVVATLVFVLLFQLPNLVNLYQPWKREKDMTPEQRMQSWAQLEEMAWLANAILPPGWLPLGSRAAAEGDILVPLLCMGGLTLIGAASLWRAYRTTVRLHTGGFTKGQKLVAPAEPPKPAIPAVPMLSAAARPAFLLERTFPFVSEQTAVIALGGFRSLLRAPEVKMMLLTPIIMLVIFGGWFFREPIEMPAFVRPLIGFGAMATMLFTLTQIVGNQFGFDRNGFRVFVLCPAPRQDILFGKNLSVVPLALALCAVMAIALQVILPMRIDHFAALLPQFVSMYAIFCMIANWLSILAPLHVPSGSLKPANPKMGTLLIHLLFSFLMVVALAPTLLPLGIEFALEQLGWEGRGLPVCLVLSVLECVAVLGLYRLVLPSQGDLLQAREQMILDVVTTKTE